MNLEVSQHKDSDATAVNTSVSFERQQGEQFALTILAQQSLYLTDTNDVLGGCRPMYPTQCY